MYYSNRFSRVFLVFNISMFFMTQVSSAANIPLLLPPPAPAACPKNALKLSVVCANVLGIPVRQVGGLVTPHRKPCCKLIEGLVDIEVAVCFCTAIKANAFGAKLDLPVSLVMLINYCQKQLPPGFRCET